MSAASFSLSRKIQEAKDEKAILDILQLIPMHSKELLEKYQDFSSLIWALFKEYRKVALEIMKKLNKDQFLNSFISAEVEYQKLSSEFLMTMLDFDSKILPQHLHLIIDDLKVRKMLALLNGSIGISHFHKIPWTLEGHHNYPFIHKTLFEMILNNQKQIMEKIDAKLAVVSLHLEQKTILLKAIHDTVLVMLELHSGKVHRKIIPVLVGTKSGGHLHAEGFVWYDPKYLIVERSKSENKSGVDIYEVDEKFNRKEFDAFIKIAQASMYGMDAALDYEYYTGQTTASGHFKKIGRISMTPQDPKNCPTASAEGIYLAVFYCKLLDMGFDENLAKVYAKEYATLIFNVNKLLEMERISKKASSTQDDELKNFLKDIDVGMRPKEQLHSQTQVDTKTAAAMGSIPAVAVLAIDRKQEPEIIIFKNLGSVIQEEPDVKDVKSEKEMSEGKLTLVVRTPNKPPSPPAVLRDANQSTQETPLLGGWNKPKSDSPGWLSWCWEKCWGGRSASSKKSSSPKQDKCPPRSN